MDKIINWLKSITISALFDLIKDYIKTILTILISLLSLFIFSLFKDKILAVLKYEIQIWMTLLIILALFLFLKMYEFQKSKMKHNFVKYGLKWVIKIKKRKVDDIQGPFCTKCDYEFSNSDFSENNQCPKCFKKYPKNKDNIKVLKKKVSSFVEADLRVGTVLNIDWSIYNFPNSEFSISNTGSFIVKNIDVDINMDMNGKTSHIGTYFIDSISSDEPKKIDDFDSMNKINQIFNDLKLIESNVDVIEDIQGQEDGNAKYIEREIEWNTLMKEFSSRLIINITYSFRNKKESTKAKYSLEFKYTYTPPEYPTYIDNFEVSLNKIE